MRLSLSLIALSAAGAFAQTSTVTAPCGTSCPSPAPDKMITRSAPAVSDATPCPSLLVSSIMMNGSNPTAPGQPKSTQFTGGAGQVVLGGSVAAIAAAVMVMAL